MLIAVLFPEATFGDQIAKVTKDILDSENNFSTTREHEARHHRQLATCFGKDHKSPLHYS